MTCVSSECSRFFNLQVPQARAARTSALFEMLLEPGVAMLTGEFVGVPARTVTASESTLRITSSGTTVAFGSWVAPIRERRTTFFAGPAFFLSTFIMSSRRSMVSSFDVGREAIRGSCTETGRL